MVIQPADSHSDSRHMNNTARGQKKRICLLDVDFLRTKHTEQEETEDGAAVQSSPHVNKMTLMHLKCGPDTLQEGFFLICKERNTHVTQSIMLFHDAS